MKKIFKKRNKARKIILQYLYSITLNANNISILHQISMQNNNKIDIQYINNLLKNITKKMPILNKILEHNIKENTSISIIEKIIIQIAIFELLFYKDIPIKVIINESLELSKKFCSKNSHILINRILNNIIHNFIYNNKLLL